MIYPNILYDPEEFIEVIFDCVIDSMDKTFVNEVINFKRHSDGQYESFTAGPGSREISIKVKSSDPSTLRRQLDYLRRSKKHLILLLGAFDFASEVVIKDFKMVDSTSTDFIFELSFSCFGDNGQMRTAADTRCSGIAETSDSNAIDGYASVLDAQNEYMRFEVIAGSNYMDVADYMIIARAKASASVANDLTVRAYDSTASSATITANHQVSTSGYTYCLSEGSITATQAGHTMQIEAKKATTTTNSISVDMLAYIQSSQNMTISTPSSSTTIELSPTYDNRMRSAASTTVDGSSVYNDIGGSGANPVRFIIAFDLSSIPSGSTITSAVISLYWYYPAGATRTNNTVVGVYRPRYTWNASYVCWANRASGTAWTNAGGDYYDSAGVSQGTTPYASVTFTSSTVPDNAFHDWDVTTLVQSYVSGTYSNYGFLFKASTESSNYIAFYSKEYSSTAMRPKLTITYT